jgi:hypothetical protein
MEHVALPDLAGQPDGVRAITGPEAQTADQRGRTGFIDRLVG